MFLVVFVEDLYSPICKPDSFLVTVFFVKHDPVLLWESEWIHEFSGLIEAQVMSSFKIPILPSNGCLLNAFEYSLPQSQRRNLLNPPKNSCHLSKIKDTQQKLCNQQQNKHTHPKPGKTHKKIAVLFLNLPKIRRFGAVIVSHHWHRSRNRSSALYGEPLISQLWGR